MRKLALVVLAPLLLGAAYAQAATPVATDIAGWFASTAALAVVVAAVVAFLREHLLKSLAGIGVVLVSVIVGAALGFVGQLLNYVEGGVIAGLAFGASAGLLASGGWDAVAGLLGKRSAG